MKKKTGSQNLSAACGKVHSFSTGINNNAPIATNPKGSTLLIQIKVVQSINASERFPSSVKPSGVGRMSNATNKASIASKIAARFCTLISFAAIVTPPFLFTPFSETESYPGNIVQQDVYRFSMEPVPNVISYCHFPDGF